MREIKFRAWMNNEMHDDIVIVRQWDDKDWGCPLNAGIQAFLSHGEGQFVLMQYTGLKDKNGVEIYEGDIIETNWHWNTPHIIVWPDDYYDIIEFGLGDFLVVIGNIYENPELLKEEESGKGEEEM